MVCPAHVVANRSWDDYGLGRADSQAHLAALDLVYRGFIESHREAITKTEKSDPVTQGMLVDQTGELEQYHWFVRSHLQDYAGGLANAGADYEIGAAQSAVRKVASATSADAKGSSTAHNARHVAGRNGAERNGAGRTKR